MVAGNMPYSLAVDGETLEEVGKYKEMKGFI
jgi:hypothetical protein